MITFKALFVCDYCGVNVNVEMESKESTPCLPKKWQAVPINRGKHVHYCPTCCSSMKRPRENAEGLWKDNDTFHYTGTSKRGRIFAGLFTYHGFGSGVYYSRDGYYYSCTTSEAQELAKEDTLEFVYEDTFSYYDGAHVCSNSRYREKVAELEKVAS